MANPGMYRAIVIGVSAGGFKALHAVFAGLPKGFVLPILLVQHRMEDKEDYLIQSLDSICALSVKEAVDKEEIKPGHIYMAPANYHLLVEEGETLALSVDEPVSYARPSIDVLFDSAARQYQQELVGIILTGANSDGSAGICAVKDFGGLTLAQEPNSADSPAMPVSAISTGKVDVVLSLDEMVDFLVNLVE